MENKRKPAVKLLISDLNSGTYIKRPGWEPSGVLTKYGEVSRVNLMGVIVSLSKEDNNNSFIIDDGSGNILIRAFEDLKAQFKLGDLVSVIGRPREFSQSKYVVPEILTRIDNKKWFDAYKLEVKLQSKTKAIKLPVETEGYQEEAIETGPYQKVLNTIVIMDKGSGVEVQDIVSHLNVQGCDKIITALMEEGEIFEVSPGKVKVLE